MAKTPTHNTLLEMNSAGVKRGIKSFGVWILVAYASAVIGMCLSDLMNGRVPRPAPWAFWMVMYWQPIVVGGAAATILTEFGILGTSET